jgi:hypothetical protein
MVPLKMKTVPVFNFQKLLLVCTLFLQNKIKQNFCHIYPFLGRKSPNFKKHLLISTWILEGEHFFPFNFLDRL